MRILLLVFAMASCVQAQETESSAPKIEKISSEPKIIFPIVPVLAEEDIPEEDVVPAPAPPKPPRTPKFVSELSEETWLVIESSEKIVVTSSPLGHVSVQPEEGPVKVRGKFADGTGKIETRTFTSKYLYFINAVKKGTIEILVFNPSEVTEEKDIPRYTLHVMGVTPIPPPEPEPGPTPEPEPDPVVVKSFRVIFVKESGQTLPGQKVAVSSAKAVRDYLTAKTTPEGGVSGWREYDPQQTTVNEQPAIKALWDTVKPQINAIPCMIIEVNGHAKVLPFPETVDEALRILKESGGDL